MNRIVVALDVETTGLQFGEDEIIEIGAVKFQGAEVLETFTQLIQPRQALPLKITRLTGITPAMLADKPRFSAVAPEFVRFLGKYPLIGHTVSFDINMLKAQGVKFAQPVYDTFELATLLLPQTPIYKLSALAEQMGIPHPSDHRALNDADICRQVFLHLLERIDHLPLNDLKEIIFLLNKANWDLEELFTEVWETRSRNPFTEAAPRKGESADPSPTFGPLWGSNEAKAASRKPPSKPHPLGLQKVAAFFSPQGAMQQVFPAYEQRPQQVQMAEAVAKTFSEGGVLLVEAGTGTGKSMAYLIPAALFALQKGERVVISTNTVNLQDQLFRKDLPDLQQILQQGEEAKKLPPSPLVAALLKGRRNYLCLRRYKELRASVDLQPEQARMLAKVQFWLPTTTSGDYAELLFNYDEQAVWGSINVPIESCTALHCADYQECFFFKARQQAEAAHLVIVNHALLVADMAVQSKVLPDYDCLVIDEAHNLEDVATEQLTFRISQADTLRFFNELVYGGGPRNPQSFLANIQSAFQKSRAKKAELERANNLDAELRKVLPRAIQSTNLFFETLATFSNSELALNNSALNYDNRLRLVQDIRQKPEWAAIEQVWENLSLQLKILDSGFGDLETLLLDVKEADLPKYDELLLQTQALKRYLTDLWVQTTRIVLGDEEGIFWLNRDFQKETLTLHAAPLQVEATLQPLLFQQKQTCILTSATLTVKQSFSYLRERLGFEEATEAQFDSPFDFKQQALLLLPDDIPEPNQRGYQQMLENTLIELCKATGGQTLALFTAISALKQTRTGIQEVLEQENIVVLGQGVDGSRRTLLERFRESPRTVLLGTNSFWEGVDIVGEALSILVITKLPFNVPTDPIFAARSELFEDAFNEYAVPQSILRFKQGFGRLIRSRKDRGIVIVLDKRLLTKRYGQAFLQSLPDLPIQKKGVKFLPTLAADFLKG